MTSFKKRIVFDEPAKQESSPNLATKQQFNIDTQFIPVSVEGESSAEQGIAKVLTVKKKRWGMRCLAISGVALTIWQSVDSLVRAGVNQDWLTLGWSGFVTGIAAVGITAIGREFFALQRLKGRQDTKEKLQTMIAANGIGKAKSECEQLAKNSKSELTPGFDKWQNALAVTHNDREVFELYDGLVLQEQDKLAKQIVSKHALEAGIMVAVSPLALVDMLFVAWRNIYLVDQIANLYGVSLGYWSRIRLLRVVLVNMALAGAAEVISDTGMDLLSVGVAGKLSSRAAQGLGIGLLTARLGFKAIALIRPLPHLACQAPKLSDVRRELLSKLTH